MHVLAPRGYSLLYINNRRPIPLRIGLPNSRITGAVRHGSAGTPRFKPELAQLGHQAVAVLALDLDHAMLHGAAGTAQSLQPRRELLELRRVDVQPTDDRDHLPTAACDLAADTHAPLTL
jgi:hypothetical protein